MRFKIIFLIQFAILRISTAQPVDHEILFNEEQFSKPFIHCTEKPIYFAKFAVEAHSTLLDFQDTIYCKLHIPPGLFNLSLNQNKVSEEYQSEFDYSKEQAIILVINFYVNGVKVSSAQEFIGRPEKEDDLFTFYFNLNSSANFSEYKEINKAYLELIRNLKNPFSSVVLEAVIPSKNPNSERYKKIAYGSISMKADLIKLEEWKNLSGRK